MKFGKFLHSQEVPGWEFYYLSYNRLKKTLVTKSTYFLLASLEARFDIRSTISKEVQHVPFYRHTYCSHEYVLRFQL
jgi:hypothetical protein